MPKGANALIAAALLAAASLAQAVERPDRSTAAPAWCADRCDELVVDWNATAYQVIKGGSHFRFATEEGLKLGRNVGRHTMHTLLVAQD